MAQYTYNYACGHGQGSVALSGKLTERYRKLDWYERNLVCLDCYKKERQELDAKAPKVAQLHAGAVLDQVSASIRLTGQLEANKDALSAMGFCWSGAHGTIQDLLSLKPPVLVFQVSSNFEFLEDMQKWISGFKDKLDDLGYTLHGVDDIGRFMSLEVFKNNEQKRLAQQEAREKANAAGDKPVPPEWRQALGENKRCWNGKFYGTLRYGYSIYWDNKKIELTKEQVQAYKTWLDAVQAWKAKYGIV